MTKKIYNAIIANLNNRKDRTGFTDLRGATMFYAINCEYGVRAISDADRLARFAAKAERDAWVAADWEHREAVSRKEARRRFPGAFGGDLAVIDDTYKINGNGFDAYWSLRADGSQVYMEW